MRIRVGNTPYFYLWRNLPSKSFLFVWLHNQLALFVSVFFLHFVLALLRRVRENKTFLIVAYSSNIIVFLFSLVFPYHFIGAVNPKMNFPFYTDKPGILYLCFTLLFIIEAGYAIREMVKVYPFSSGIKKTQIKYTIIASIIGFVFGGSTFPLVYDIPVYP